RLHVPVHLIDVRLLPVVREQVAKVREMLQTIRQLTIDDPVGRDRIEDVVVGLRLRLGERGDEVGAGAEPELDRLLEVPLSEAVELRVALELHPIDALEILEQPEVLTKSQEPRAD